MTLSSLQSRIIAPLHQSPDSPCIQFYEGGDTPVWQTRETFYGRGLWCAAQLADRGVKAGEVCVLVLPSGEASATFTLAVLLCGAIPLHVAPPVLQGLNSELPRILKNTVQRTGATLVVMDDAMQHNAEDYPLGKGRQLCFVSDFGEAGCGDESVIHIPSPDQVACMQLTSGTTALPKICVWRHAGVLAALDAMQQAMELGDGDRFFNWTPLYHDMGLVNNFFLTLSLGIPITLMNPHLFVKQPHLWLKGLDVTQSTVTWSPNFGYALAAKMIRDEDLQGVNLSHVQGFWNAAERIHLDTLKAFESRFAPYGVRHEAMKTNFGCAENVGGATFTRSGEGYGFERIDREAFLGKHQAIPAAEEVPEEQVLEVVGAGRPSPGLQIDILSPEGETLEDGFIGEVVLQTPSRLEEYLEDEEATREALVGANGVRTGDMGYMRDGEFYWTGRVKERINIHGKKLDPSDLEHVLLDVHGLRKGCFCAFGVDDKATGTQKVVVVSEARPDEENPLQKINLKIREQIMVRLGVQVNEVLLVKPGTLTKTSSGKRRHQFFKQLYLDGMLDTALLT